MIDVIFWLLVWTWAMAGIGTFVGTLPPEEDSIVIAFLRFVVYFVFWPTVLAYKLARLES